MNVINAASVIRSLQVIATRFCSTYSTATAKIAIAFDGASCKKHRLNQKIKSSYSRTLIELGYLLYKTAS